MSLSEEERTTLVRYQMEKARNTMCEAVRYLLRI